MGAVMRYFLPLLLLACGDNGLSQSWQLDRLRVLGVRAEPAEPRPGDAVTFDSLVYLPAGETMESVVWFACLPQASDNYGCQVDPAIFESLGEADPNTMSPEELAELFAAAQAAGLIGVEPFLPPAWIAPADALDGLDEIGAKEGVSALINLSAVPVGAEGDEDVELAYKRVPISLADTPNHNPALDGVGLRLSNADGKDLGDEVLLTAASEVTVVEAGKTYKLTPQLPEGAIEDYDFTTSEGTVETRTEEPYFTWYTEGGGFDQPFSLHPYSEVLWTAPDQAWQGVVITVMRDRRGGMAWEVLNLQVE